MDRDDTEFLQVALKKLSLLTRLKVAESSKAVSVRSDSTGVA
jgi:predicted MarR family transcription regulator